MARISLEDRSISTIIGVFILSFVLSSLFLILFWIAIELIQLPNNIAIIKGSTQSISFVVTNPRATTIPTFGMKWVSRKDRIVSCVEYIEPAMLSTVIYVKSDNKFQIIIEKSSKHNLPTLLQGTEQQFSVNEDIILYQDGNVCGPKLVPNYLPLFGKTEIGGEFLFRAVDDLNPTLIEGHLDLLVNTVKLPFIFSKSSIYAGLTAPIPLPAGSRLEPCVNTEDVYQLANAKNTLCSMMGYGQTASTYGVVQVNEDLLKFSLSSNLDTVILKRPGSEAEYINIRLLYRIFNDPIMLTIQATIGALAIILPGIGLLTRYYLRKRSGDQISDCRASVDPEQNRNSKNVSMASSMEMEEEVEKDRAKPNI